jgi:hypothetical protein
LKFLAVALDRRLSPAVGLLSLDPESSPEWLLGPESGLLASWFWPFRPDTDPDELELLLVVVVVVAVSPLLVGPACRILRGETGEPRSSSRKSGLLASQLSESRKRSLSASSPGSKMGFPECDIFPQTKQNPKLQIFKKFAPVSQKKELHFSYSLSLSLSLFLFLSNVRE